MLEKKNISAITDDSLWCLFAASTGGSMLHSEKKKREKKSRWVIIVCVCVCVWGGLLLFFLTYKISD